MFGKRPDKTPRVHLDLIFFTIKTTHFGGKTIYGKILHYGCVLDR